MHQPRVRSPGVPTLVGVPCGIPHAGADPARGIGGFVEPPLNQETRRVDCEALIRNNIALCAPRARRLDGREGDQVSGREPFVRATKLLRRRDTARVEEPGTFEG